MSLSKSDGTFFSSLNFEDSLCAKTLKTSKGEQIYMEDPVYLPFSPLPLSGVHFSAKWHKMVKEILNFYQNCNKTLNFISTSFEEFFETE